MMCGCKNQLMKNVYETGFALDEILLYLDTHPTGSGGYELLLLCETVK